MRPERFELPTFWPGVSRAAVAPQPQRKNLESVQHNGKKCSKYCLVVLRVEPQYQLGSPEEELSKGRTGASGSSPPGEVESSHRDAVFMDRHPPRSLQLPLLLKMTDLQEYQGFGFLNAF